MTLLRLTLCALALAGGIAHETQRTYTTNWGAPVDEGRASLTVGQTGPVLLQDALLIDRLQTQNRERIPDRVVHARGAVGKGTFKVTHNCSDLTIADFLNTDGQETKMAVRFSTVIHGRDSPEFLRDPRGFAVKFYTDEGNYDIVGNNWPVFFVNDAIRFPELVRAMKPDPVTNAVEWWRRLDFLGHYPQTAHALTFLLDDAGIPRNYRVADGFGIHTFKMLNSEGNEVYIRWQWLNQQGATDDTPEKAYMLDEEAVLMPFGGHGQDLFESIEQGDFPKWTLYLQTLDPDHLYDTEWLENTLDFDPLDASKLWPVDQFPLREVGVMELNENPYSKYLEDDMIAFAPSRMVPGILPSNDKLLQGRLFSYVDAQRYRLGSNYMQLEVNRPKNPYFDGHIDGWMNQQGRRGASASRVNYFPSFTEKLVESENFPVDPERLKGKKSRDIAPEVNPSANDFVQAGDRFRSWGSDRKNRFAERVASTLSEDRVSSEIVNVWMEIWNEVDPSLPRLIGGFMQDCDKGDSACLMHGKQFAAACGSVGRTQGKKSTLALTSRTPPPPSLPPSYLLGLLVWVPSLPPSLNEDDPNAHNITRAIFF
jgi:catalase